ncbi:MAG: alanine--tRNA ligase [Bacilli bacterium]|nr:alanine--tRNA ligase [Bacilli bacterium]
MKTSKEIRQMYIDFFVKHDHKVIDSSSLIPKDDPSLLWNNAGVTPIKKYFDGSVIPDSNRLVSYQKCLRTNDIESVGDDTHHTFFEMLGNFSIGDYFKKEAIEMSYELLTSKDYFNIDINKIYVTIYPDDEEAYSIWKSLGLSDDHIVRLEGNFWEIGEGPCGPDSEIFYDRGPEYDKDNIGIKLLKEEIENNRYVEIWNNVFSQYNSKEGLNREQYPELPKKNIDTGMGFERIVMVLQNKNSSYDTDLFMPIISEIEKLCNKTYDSSKEFRIIADHIRAIVFAISDGALFSNEGRGYVLRRLLRRAVRQGRKLGVNDTFMYKLVDIVVINMKYAYNNLDNNVEYIKSIVLKEEELFNKTLVSGEKRLNELMNNSSDKVISGEEVFKLYDTYGFPFELTNEILSENGYLVNKDEFDKYMDNQKNLARQARNNEYSMNIQNEELINFKDVSKFIGYTNDECDCKVIGMFKDNKLVSKCDDECYIMLSETPFYAEMGGQINDTGIIYNDDVKMNVLSVLSAPNKQHMHLVSIDGIINVGDSVKCKINVNRRRSIEKNHSATHLLHKALKEVIDGNIYQCGSRVDEYSLRFDFSYSKKITDEDIINVESKVNEYIKNNSDVIINEDSLENARKNNVTALFDEKYEDVVRIVNIGDYAELCGGTHVKNTSEIITFAIKSLENKGLNVYRIEATTDNNIENQLYEKIKTYNIEMIKLLEKSKKIIDSALKDGIELKLDIKIDNSKPKSYSDIIFNRDEVNNVRIKVNELENKYFDIKSKKALENIKYFEDKIVKNNDFDYLIMKIDNYDINVLKQIIDVLINKMNNGFIFIANIVNDNVNYISKSNNININSGELIKITSTRSKGNGGGSHSFGQGGGTDVSNLDILLEEISNVVIKLKK